MAQLKVAVKVALMVEKKVALMVVMLAGGRVDQMVVKLVGWKVVWKVGWKVGATADMLAERLANVTVLKLVGVKAVTLAEKLDIVLADLTVNLMVQNQVYASGR